MPKPAVKNPRKTVALTHLIFEERVKRELPPLEAYPQLLENAAAATGRRTKRAFSGSSGTAFFS